MNVKDLKYFVKLQELKSYSDTAHYFGVSQPTITYAVKRLETEYQTELIVRKSYANSVTLTHAGDQILAHAKKILREDHLMQKDLQRIRDSRIKMGFPPIITNYLVPLVFDQLRDNDLLSRIEPVRSGSKELLDKLYNGDIDIALLGTTRIPENGNFDFNIIKVHNFKIIASSERQFPKELKIRGLQNEDVLILDESSVHQLIVNNIIEKYNVFTNVIYQTSDYRLLLDLVKRNKGISLITETALQVVEGIQELNVVDETFPPFYIMLIYRSSLKAGRHTQKIIDIFSEL